MHQIARQPAREPVEQPPSTSEGRRYIQHLYGAKKAAYGGLFTSMVATPEEIRVWERLWMACFEGKDSDTIGKAIRACLDTYSRPFTPSEFRTQYQQLAPKAMNQAYRPELPRTTWSDRTKNGLRHIAEIKESLGPIEEPSTDERKQTVYGDEYFAARGYPKYKPGEEELKSYI